MKTRSIFATILAGIMAVSAMSVSAFAAETESVPYDIDTKTVIVDSKDDLEWVSSYSNLDSSSDSLITGIPTTFNGWTINITKEEIVFPESEASNWTPIKNFQGTMQGVSENGYVTISGLNVSVDGNGAGLCGTTSGRPHFANIKIANSSFEASDNYAGAFIGNGFVSYFDNCHAENVVVTANRFVGGIVGTTYGNITNCSVTGTDTKIFVRGTSILSPTDGDNVGGIVGLVGEGNTVISNCLVDGITVTGARQVAGIAGAVQYGNTIKNCTVKNCNIESVGTGLIILRGATPCAGGIVGQLAAASDTQKINIIDNTVENTSVTQKRTGTKYIGWAVGDANTRLTTEQYVISGNEYIGTTDLNEVGFRPANPSEAN